MRETSDDAPEAETAQLPATVQRLWGISGDREEGQRRGLSLSRVVEAAVAIADAEGVDAVSMGRVASELGFTTMALYRHVDNKDQLLQLMVDAAADEPPPLPGDLGWREALERWAFALLATLRARSWVVDVPVSGIPIGPGQVRWVEAGLAVLRPTGLADDEKLAVIVLLTGQIRWEAHLSRDLERARGASGQTWLEIERDYAQQLTALLDPERFPELTRVATSGVFGAPQPGGGDDLDTGFTFGLVLVLDGLERLVDARGRQP